MELNTIAYEDAASSTVPPEVHVDAIQPEIFFSLLGDFIAAGKAMNLYLKKPMVYGPTRLQDDETTRAILASATTQGALQPFNLTDKEKEFAHGAVGLATEATEVIEVLFGRMFQGIEIDQVNVSEEIGDCLWYLVRAARSCPAPYNTLSGAMERNIFKLENRHKRDGATFNPDGDRTRDLDAERALLEAPAAVQAIVEGAAATPLDAGLQKLKEVTATATDPGNAHASHYLRGMANGLKLAVSCFDGREPAYIEADAVTGEVLHQEKSNAEAVDSLYAPKGSPGISIVESFDDGTDVYLERYSGGNAPEGLFGKLMLVTYHKDEPGVGQHREYIACDLIAPPGVTLKVGDVSASAPNAEELHKMLNRPNLGLATNLELGTELEARHRLGHTEPHYQTTQGTPYRGPGSFYAEHGRDKNQDFK